MSSSSVTRVASARRPRSPAAAGGRHPRGARRRLRRHRHQPALRAARVLPRAACASTVTRGNVLGVLSLIFWSLVLVISVKYLIFVMRADNQGEGGILALMALVPAELPQRAEPRRARGARPVRRGAAVRRRHDHAGHLGARRDGGPHDRDAASSSPTSCRSRSSSSSRCSCCSARHRAASARSSAGDARLVRHDRRARRPLRSCSDPEVLAAVEPAPRVGLLPRATASTASSCSAPCSSSSPAARRSTPTWATSASGRSASRGSRSCCRRCCSTTSARARCCSATRSTPSIRSTCSRPSGCCTRSSALATLAAVIASQALISGCSRSRGRPCSSATARAWRSATRPAETRARSTSRR